MDKKTINRSFQRMYYFLRCIRNSLLTYNTIFLNKKVRYRLLTYSNVPTCYYTLCLIAYEKIYLSSTSLNLLRQINLYDCIQA